MRFLHGIGETRAKALERLGIFTVRDLIAYLPRRYEDRRAFRSMGELCAGESVCVCGMVSAPPTLTRLPNRLTVVKLRVVDATGSLSIVFFNQPYQRTALHAGESYLFYGRVEQKGRLFQMTNPLYGQESMGQAFMGLVPHYTLTAGISQKLFRQAMAEALANHAPEDRLPPALREQYGLLPLASAYREIHFPTSEESLQLAQRRLAWDDLFFFALGLEQQRTGERQLLGYRCHAVDLTPFTDALPFSLTSAQKRCIAQILADMERGQPMHRLCQGDVGSGKTMVAAGAIYFSAQNALQSALMAPTELLAQQHFRSLAPLLEPLGVRCSLLTGSTPKKERRVILSALALGEIDLLIGTHALFTEDVVYARLGLVVTDEQHRFGVKQRTQLLNKGEQPHLLVMSATPIPRTLALLLYGDLDISLVDELPPNRHPVDTYCVGESYRQRLWAFLGRQIEAGHQIYLVCSLVEENDEAPDERKAVTQYTEQLQREVFPQYRLAALHGRMKAKEKEAVMLAFSRGEVDILVSTTVVEVGVDVPNATVMLIENAERFGLSQLHQLRGRVGRGSAQSYCILLSDTQNPQTKERLTVLTQSHDGFHIAEEDLRLRGPGDIFGTRQHGVAGIRSSTLFCQPKLWEEVRLAAGAYLEQDPTLAESPTLQAEIALRFAPYQQMLH